MEQASSTPTESVSAVDPPPQWFRDIVWGSLLAGLCPPVPIPFLEDWGRNYLRRRLVRGIFFTAGLQPSAKQVKILAGEHDTGCFWQIVTLPFRWLKILRILYWAVFASKLIRPVSDLFVEMYMLSHAVRTGNFGATQLLGGDAECKSLHQTIEAVRKKVDLHPFLSIFEKVFRGSANLVLEFSRDIGKRVWSARKKKPEESMDLVPDEDAMRRFPRGEELVHALWADRQSLDNVNRTFQEEFELQKKP